MCSHRRHFRPGQAALPRSASMMRRMAGLAAATVVAGALAGCSSSSQEPADVPTDAPTVSTSPDAEDPTPVAGDYRQLFTQMRLPDFDAAVAASSPEEANALLGFDVAGTYTKFARVDQDGWCLMDASGFSVSFVAADNTYLTGAGGSCPQGRQDAVTLPLSAHWGVLPLGLHWRKAGRGGRGPSRV